MKRARPREGKALKRIMIFLISLISLFFVFFIMLGFHSVIFPIFNNNQDIIHEEYLKPTDKATGKANFLLIGTDKDGLRTDTIMLASYDLDNNKINILSIPRDTRMYFNNNYRKINSAYHQTKNGKMLGARGTIEAVTKLTGIPVNYYVEFSFEAFRNTIDALGEVEFYVPKRMKYSDPWQDLKIDLQEGLQMLDGDKAEQLIRYRQYEKGDIQRVETQQDFIKALAEQKLNIGILTKIPDLYSTLKKDIKTNITLFEVMKFIPNMQELSTENINVHLLPGDFSGEEYLASYWMVDLEKTKELIQTEFGYDASSISIGQNFKSQEKNINKVKKETNVTEEKKKSDNTNVKDTSNTIKPETEEPILLD